MDTSEILDLQGSDLGYSDWFLVDQQRVNDFADVTIDHQFIHVDEAAAAAGPFGGTIAHGFLTLSLLPHFLESASVPVDGLLMAINYGTDKVRFLQPVKVGQRVRGRAVLSGAEEKRPGQWLVRQTVTAEIEGEDKPAMVAEFLMLFFVQ